MADTPQKTIAQKTTEAAKQLELELVQYKLGNSAINFNLDIDHETVWASAKQIAELFDRDADTVNHHIRGIYEDGELDEAATFRKICGSSKRGRPICHPASRALRLGRDLRCGLPGEVAACI